MLRFATSAVAIPLIVGATYAGGVWFQVLVVVVLLLCVWEVCGMVQRAGMPPSPAAGALGALSFPLGVIFGSQTVTSITMAAAVVVGIFGLVRHLERQGALAGWALSLALGLYAGVLFGPPIALRDRPDGFAWILLILLATWACDSAAYFAGRTWGRTPLAPRVSPKKTVEGVIAGVAGAVAVCSVGALFLDQSLLRLIGMGVVVAAGAILGDLVESAIKRQLSAKDSGWIMPGHGGILDRIDSLLLSGFLASLYVAGTDAVKLP